MATVAFCPTDIAEHPAVDRSLSPAPFVVSPPEPGQRWVAHVAAALSSTAEPLILVFYGDASVHAPALGFSRRSLRRPAVGYVLVDPLLPAVGGEYGDWPDAPVTVVLTSNADAVARDAALQAQLRGWTVVHEQLSVLLRRLMN
jgi:hypothetical protein